MKYMKIVLGIALLVASLQAGITVMPKNEQKLDLSYYSEKNINIITPIGAIKDTNDSARIANTIFGNLGDGSIVINNTKFNICGDQTHVLSIGVNRYEYLNRLKYAVEDAKKVLSLMLDSCLKSTISGEVLLNGNKENMRNALKDIVKKVTKKDTVVIYFAGHGSVINGKKIIALSDTRSKNDTISLESIFKEFKDTHAKVFIFVDASFTDPTLR